MRLNNTNRKSNIPKLGKKNDIVMPMYNLIIYSDAYLKTSGSLWQYYRDEPTLGTNDNIIDFPVSNNNSASFKFEQQIKGQTGSSKRC